MASSRMPEFPVLVDFVEGRLGAAESRRVAAAVDADADARAAVEWIRTFRRNASGVTLAAPPPAVRETLARRFAARAAGQPSALRRLVASLGFDSATATTATRGAGDGRQLVYGTERGDVLVSALPLRERIRVSGQVLATVEAPIVVELQGKTVDLLTVADELGEFSFPPVSPGTYDLVLTGGDAWILVEGATLSL